MAEPALSILRDVLQGAYTLRRRGAVYRDIKLQNMLLAENGRTVFCYHGQAITMPNPESNRIRNPGIFLYLAPGLRSGDVDGKTNVYAIALVANFIFVGYLAGDGAALRDRALTESIVDWIEAGLDLIPGNLLWIHRRMFRTLVIRACRRAAIPSAPPNCRSARYGSPIPARRLRYLPTIRE